MSKYSGIFLSLPLIMICLWINICRYPKVSLMLDGNAVVRNVESAGENPDSSHSEPSQPNDGTDDSRFVSSETAGSSGQVASQAQQNGEEIADSAAKFGEIQRQQSPTEQNYWRNSSYSRPISGEEPQPSDKPSDSKNQAPNAENPDVDRSVKNEVAPKSPNVRSVVSNANQSPIERCSQAVLDKKAISFAPSNVDAVAFSNARSNYKAVGSDSTQPMNFDSPNYSNNNDSKIVPCSINKTIGNK